MSLTADATPKGLCSYGFLVDTRMAGIGISATPFFLHLLAASVTAKRMASNADFGLCLKLSIT
ncbi:TPA: hypothetical protein EYO77_08010 [Candidatus Poribacteria bacterium]|nr:hypothetical protein [Candidatus Poribacteria bacterium]